ncbi:MAG: hypothetical protein U9N82_06000 [Thermodesulfobacteriota bacterium]|nr:hypothetical protein [Thermodesulfobacteriota bacterium]
MRRDYSAVTFIISVMLLLAGCAGGHSLPTTKGYSQLCERYLDQNIQALFDEWGPPGKTLRLSDGNKVYAYAEMKDESVFNPLDHAFIAYPSHTRSYDSTGKIRGDYSHGEFCITYFEVDRSNKIVRIVWTGDCLAGEIK